MLCCCCCCCCCCCSGCPPIAHKPQKTKSTTKAPPTYQNGTAVTSTLHQTTRPETSYHAHTAAYRAETLQQEQAPAYRCKLNPQICRVCPQSCIILIATIIVSLGRVHWSHFQHEQAPASKSKFITEKIPFFSSLCRTKSYCQHVHGGTSGCRGVVDEERPTCTECTECTFPHAQALASECKF